MRVDLNTPVTRNTSTEKPTKPAPRANQDPSVGADADSSQDRVTLSLAAKVLQNPEIRQDKVDQVRHAISTGQYKVDAGKIADAILGKKS